jgi:site-specific recombinase XerD
MSYWEDVDNYVEEYCRVTKQYSDNTIRNYRNTLSRFGQYLDEQSIIHTKDIDQKVVSHYRDYLSRKVTNRKEAMSQRAQAYQVIVLRSFLTYLRKQGHLVLNPESLELPKTKMRRIEYLTDKEVQKIINFILHDTSSGELQRQRNRAIIVMTFGSGLRISELLALKKSDISEDDNRLVIQGKGGKVRSSFVSDSAFSAILEYLRARGKDDNPYLFINHSKNQPLLPNEYKPLTPRMVQLMLKSAASAVGIFKKISPHTLRHSFATKILLEGGDLRSVQVLLGHTNLSTTQIYTHLTDTTIRDLHKRVFGKKESPNI